MRVKVKFGALMGLVALLLALVAAGCGSSSNGGSSSSGSSTPTEPAGEGTTAAAPGGGEEPTIGWISPLPDPWAKTMGKAIELQAEKLGMKVKTLEANYDPNLQLEGVDSMIQSELAAILTIPIDTDSMQPGIDRAHDAGIPFLEVLGYELGNQHNVSMDAIGEDKEVAEEIGELAAKEAGADCAAGIMSGPPGVTILELRAEGLRAGLEKGGCKILDEQHNAEGSPEKATEIAQSWRTRFGGEMNVITGTDDTNAEGSLVAKEGDFQPILTGFDGEDTAIKLIESGEMLATASQAAAQLGNTIAYAAYQLLNGEKVPQQPVIPGEMVTADSLAEFRNEEELITGPMDVEFVKDGSRWIAETKLP
jgi:ABC-type sugar transport system substrate-binding protein